MVFAPAICIGFGVICGAAYILIYAVSDKVQRSQERRARQRPDWTPPPTQRTSGGMSTIEALSLAGGIVAAGAALVVLLTSPRESQATIWYGLTGLGILGGLLTFVLSDSKSKPSFARRGRPMASTPSHPADRRSPPPPPQRTPPSPGARPSAQNLYQNLLFKTRNNRDLADRLIEYERKRTPTASEEQLIRNAIWRWERDNR